MAKAETTAWMRCRPVRAPGKDINTSRKHRVAVSAKTVSPESKTCVPVQLCHFLAARPQASYFPL